jgi:hypothetical protein
MSLRESRGLRALSLLIALSLPIATHAQPLILSKEYIHLGGRILAIEVQQPSGDPIFEGWNTLNSGSGTAGWRVVAAADFDGNGVPDLVWQNTSTGQVNVNYYGGTGGSTLTGFAMLNSGSGTAGWQVVGAADFDGNGVPDLIWQNTSTNQVNVNYYGGAGGSTLTGFAVLNSGAGTSGWHVVAAADFDGNGVPDLVWQNTSTNQVNVNYYGGTGGVTLTGSAVLNSGSGTSGWRVVAAADFDSNGVPDLIWQSSSSGQVNANYYGGTGGATMIGWSMLNSGAGTAGWSVVAAADFDGNGVPDLVWQSGSTGQVNVNYYWRP